MSQDILKDLDQIIHIYIPAEKNAYKKSLTEFFNKYVTASDLYAPSNSINNLLYDAFLQKINYTFSEISYNSIDLIKDYLLAKDKETLFLGITLTKKLLIETKDKSLRFGELGYREYLTDALIKYYNYDIPNEYIVLLYFFTESSAYYEYKMASRHLMQ